MKQEKSSGSVMDNPSYKSFTIRGAFYGDKTLPSLNNYLSEIGTNPKSGGRFKKDFVMIITNAIRRDLRRFRTNKPVILHYLFAEPSKGQKRDRMNIFSLADKFIEDALRDCQVIPDDSPKYVKNCTHEFIYTNGVPYIKVAIEELQD